MKAIPFILLGISAMVSAQPLVTTLPLDVLSSEHRHVWNKPVAFGTDAQQGNTLTMTFPEKCTPGGLDLQLSADIPKFDEWDEFRFNYKISHTKEWFGIKIQDKPVADGWQATWRLQVPDNADTEWQTAAVTIHKPMWKWGNGPSDARIVTFRVDHDDNKPMVLQLANLQLVRRNFVSELVNPDSPVSWTDEQARKGSLAVKCFNHLAQPVTVQLKPTGSHGLLFAQQDVALTIPKEDSVTATLAFTIPQNIADLTEVALSIEISNPRTHEVMDVHHTSAIVPMPPMESPCLLFTKAMIPEILRRIRETEAGKAMWEGLVKSADQWCAKTIEYPPRGGQWWHWYSCKKCGTGLKTEGPTRHVCPNCGEVYTGWPYDDVVLDRDHHNLAYAVRTLGIVYQLSKEERYAAKAREILLGYAERYLNYPLHDINGKPSGGGGHVTPQTLDESTWSIPMLQGFDCVKEYLSKEDIATITDKMFIPCATLIKKHQWGIHNICCWHDSAYGLAGLTLGRSDFVHAAIFGPKGFNAQMEKGVTEDGPWYERAWGYHFYTVNALMPLAIALHNTKITEIPSRYKLMFDAPLKFLTPTYQLPAFHDTGRVGFSFPGYANLYELPYVWWRDPAHGEIVRQGKHNSLEAVLHGISDFKSQGTTFLSHDYTDSGMVVMRTQSPKLAPGLIPSNYIALDYGEHGGGHGHPDKLNFVLYAHNTLIAEDPGCIAYGNPAHGGWYRQTLSHNTLVVDGLSQAPATGKTLAFAAIPQAVVCVADAGNIYKGVVARRAIAMLDDLVFDVLWADADAKHQFEYAFHARGTLQTASTATPTDTPQGDGYTWAQNWQLLASSPVHQLTWSQDNVKLAMTLLQEEPNGETRIAEGMGNPSTVKPPFVLSRLTGKTAHFGSVFQILRPDAQPVPLQASIRHDGNTIALTATVNDSTYVFTITPDDQNCKARLLHNQNGKVNTVILAN